LTRDSELRVAALTSDFNTKLSQVTSDSEAKLSKLTSDSNSRISQISNDSQQKLLEAERGNHAKLEALRAENKGKEERWAQEIEALRVTKDARIRSIEREREDQRSAYESKINELDSKIRSKGYGLKGYRVGTEDT